MKAFFGGWPMLRAVFDEQAEQGGGMSAARRSEFLELIRRRWLLEGDAESIQTDEEQSASGSRASLATQLCIDQTM